MESTKTPDKQEAAVPDFQSIAFLGQWEGYSTGDVQRLEPGPGRPRPEVWIELRPDKTRPLCCSGCGRRIDRSHDFELRFIRDLPLLDAETWLRVPRRRVQCPACGPKLERLDWLDPYARVTRRLAESVARLCHDVPILQVAGFFGLDWKTVKRIDKAYLENSLGPIDLKGVRALLMDEFAIHKGHRYATTIVDPSTKRVLWVGRGHTRESVRPFFELLGQEGCRKIRAVVMDMSTAYELEVRSYCPQAEIVFDLFHVVAKYGREVIDRVRVDEANRLRHSRRDRHVIKSSRWLLLRNRENVVRPKDRVRLREILDANKALFTVYVLKADLKHLWDFRYPKVARRFWNQWFAQAIRSRIEPLKRFALRLKPYLEGIIAHCRWRLHTSLLEGINNTIKVIKRRAYGFRDDDYFFLKIRAAFPGIGR
jgi:transposase